MPKRKVGLITQPNPFDEEIFGEPNIDPYLVREWDSREIRRALYEGNLDSGIRPVKKSVLQNRWIAFMKDLEGVDKQSACVWWKLCSDSCATGGISIQLAEILALLKKYKSDSGKGREFLSDTVKHFRKSEFKLEYLETNYDEKLLVVSGKKDFSTVGLHLGDRLLGMRLNAVDPLKLKKILDELIEDNSSMDVGSKEGVKNSIFSEPILFEIGKIKRLKKQFPWQVKQS